MATPQHLLVFRFSALGDVAMTVPVVRNLLHQYPRLHLTFVSDPFHAPLFRGIERLEFIGADTKGEYKGLAGLWRLSRKLRREVPFDAIADLHDVLRSKIVRLFLSGRSVRTAAVDKGRQEKKELTRPIDKKLRPLKTGFQRYAAVFSELGLPVTLDRSTGLAPKKEMAELPLPVRNTKLVGVAPFARHQPKVYYTDLLQKAINEIADQPDTQVLLFGAPGDIKTFDEWCIANPELMSVAGRMKFSQELDLISQLDCMISMDSANMHLASLYGVPVVSLWGGTHPWLGFYGWGQEETDALQVDRPCRPSSVFGNKPCPVHGEQGCMEGITPQMIVERVLAKIR